MHIDVYSDPICPWCYIGKKRLKEALGLRPEIPAHIRWRAFQLNPDMPEEGMDRQGYLNAKFGGEERSRQIYGRIASVGAEAGISFKFDAIKTTPNTIMAHRLLRYAQRADISQGDSVIEALFEAYFLEGRPIGDMETLLDIGSGAGLQKEPLEKYLQSDDDREDILAEDRYARTLGIGGVPCFIIDGKYALSGAQDPEAFLPIFDMALQEADNAPATPT